MTGDHAIPVAPSIGAVMLGVSTPAGSTSTTKSACTPSAVTDSVISPDVAGAVSVSVSPARLTVPLLTCTR